MSEDHSLTVAGDLICIHQVITRAVGIAIEECSLLGNNSSSDADRAEKIQGLLAYITALLQLLDSHHLVEDEVIFPYFQSRLSSFPLETMTEQHQALLPLLDELSSTLQRVSLDTENSSIWLSLKELFEQLRVLWLAHYQLEEEYLTEANISAVIDVAEQSRLCHLFAAESQKHITLDYLVLPFILYNLPPQEREIISKVFPAQVTGQLVPQEWKIKWQVMSPFLIL